MKKILKEITSYCKECASHNCCPEEQCILYRIEQLAMSYVSKRNKNKLKM